jgi:hypothetical protein
MRLLLSGFTVVLAGLCLPLSAQAQRLDVRTLNWSHASAPPGEPPQFSDYRVEGALAGAFLLGVIMAAAVDANCDRSAHSGDITTADCGGDTRRAAILFGVIGGTVGYLIGRSTPRRGG